MEIRKDDWSLCFPRCREHAGKFGKYPELWINVPLKRAAKIQLRMAAIKELKQQRDYELDDDYQWKALDYARVIRQKSLDKMLEAYQQ